MSTKSPMNVQRQHSEAFNLRTECAVLFSLLHRLLNHRNVSYTYQGCICLIKKIVK